MIRVLKKFIAVICLVSVLSTAFVFPIVSTPVQADAIAVESGSAYIYRVVVTLLSKVGVVLPNQLNGQAQRQALVDCLVRSMIVQNGGTDPGKGNGSNSNEWKELQACPNLEKITRISQAFPQFVDDLLAGVYSDSLGFQSTGMTQEKLKEVEKLLGDQSVKYEIRPSKAGRYSWQLGNSNEKPYLSNNEFFPLSLNDSINLIDSNFTSFSFERGLEFQNGSYVTVRAIPKNDDAFYFFDSSSLLLNYFSNSGVCFGLRYSGSSGGSRGFQQRDVSGDSHVYDAMGSKIGKNIRIYTNMYMRIYDDGSALLFDLDRMSAFTFNKINNSLWDMIQDNGISFKDVEFCDDSGVKVSDSASNFSSEVDNDLLTESQIESIANGNQDILDNVKKANAINKTNGETLFDISTETASQTGLLQQIVNNTKNQLRFAKTGFNNMVDGLKDVANKLGSLLSVNVKNFSELIIPLTSSMGQIYDAINNLSIPNPINSIMQGVIDIGHYIREAASTVSSAVTDPMAAIKAIPQAISDVISTMFSPGASCLANIFDKGSDIFKNHFNMPADAFKKFMIEGKEVPDVKYKVGSKEYVVIPFSYFNKFVDNFRVYIQASFVFIWIIWFANQVLSLFDKSSVITGHLSDFDRGSR
nr:MAG TPA: hypothetical protein [Inoviridae sp.]